MINLKNSITIIAMGLLVCICGLVLMTVSQKVYDKQRYVQMMDKEKLAAEWEIRALEAELAYLSRPERLEQISNAMRHNQPITEAAKTMPDYMIAPVSFSLNNPSDLQSGTIIPKSKPAKHTIEEKSAGHKNVDTEPQNFNNLLNFIGGAGE